MDVRCLTCQEPWDTYHLRHDEWSEVVYDTFDYERARAYSEKWREKGKPRLTDKVSLRGKKYTWEQLFEEKGWRFGGHSLVAVLRCPACPADAVAHPDATRAVETLVEIAGHDDDALECDLSDSASLLAELACCERCGGTLTLLGQLGSVTHYRCRDCGGDQHAEAS